MIVGVLLAAGASTRMGRPKALVSAGGESFIARGIRRLWSVCDRVVVVLGADAARIRRSTGREFEALMGAGRLTRDLAQARDHEVHHLETRFIVNRAWRRGMLSSARAGLRAALRGGPEAILVLPVDHPSVRPRTVVALGRSLRVPRDRGHRAGAVIPRFHRRRGHPIALSPALARAVCADAGASDLSDAIRRNARHVDYMDVGDPGVVRNRNTSRD